MCLYCLIKYAYIYIYIYIYIYRLSLLKRNCKETKFSVSRNEIPTIREKNFKSLGRCYSLPLTDRYRWQDLRKQLQNGFRSIDKCDLVNKDKIWCIYFGLIPKLAWPLQIYEVSLTKIETNGAVNQ